MIKAHSMCEIAGASKSPVGDEVQYSRGTWFPKLSFEYDVEKITILQGLGRIHLTSGFQQFNRVLMGNAAVGLHTG